MKKLKNKLSKSLKLFLVFSMLFNSFTPLSVVFADELDNTDNQPVNDVLNNDETKNDNEMNNDTTKDESNDDTTNENNNDETLDNSDDDNKDVFTVTVNDTSFVITYSNADKLTDETIIINEDYEYLDKTTYGGLSNTINLTDEIKDSLKEGYEIESEILNEVTFDGTYTVSVTIGEEEANASSDRNTESGAVYELYTLDGTLLEENEEGKYVVSSDTEGIEVVTRVLQGGLTPSDTFTFNDEEISLEDLINGIVIDNITLAGNLHGEFSKNISAKIVKNEEDEISFEETLNIVYGSYDENTALLNESAKNTSLDKKYAFYGNDKHGVLYLLDELNIDEITTILDDAFAGNENIAYGYEEGIVILQDSNGVWMTFTEVYPSEDTKITTKLTDENEEIDSGTEFSVNYLVTLKDFAINGVKGILDYDKDILELVSVTSEKFTGSNEEDSFMFIGDSITGKTVTDDEGKETIEEEEYLIITVTFKALTAGTSKIAVKEAKFFNNDVYYVSEEDSEIEVIINSSDDNSLKELTVAGQNIELQEDVLEYELEVANDVTTVDVEAIVANQSAEITSVVSPEELSVGENVITIVVKAANGEEKVYTIKVNRAEAPKEEEAPVTTYSTQSYDNTTEVTDNNDDNKEVIKDNDDDEDDEKEEVKDNKGNKVTRMIVIGLIALAVIGLIYLIFKDDDKDDKHSSPINKPNNDKPKNKEEHKDNKKNDFNKNNKKER